MFWPYLIGFAVLYALQTLLALRQAKNFSETFKHLRRRGPVAIGKNKGLLTAGAIVMLLVDADGVIICGTKLGGVTVLSRFRELDAFNGCSLLELAPERDRRFTKSLRRAVANARDNYAIVHAGGLPTEPPGPLTQMGSRARRLMRRPATA